jgi:hypothetical protein
MQCWHSCWPDWCAAAGAEAQTRKEGAEQYSARVHAAACAQVRPTRIRKLGASTHLVLYNRWSTATVCCSCAGVLYGMQDIAEPGV